MNELTHQTQLDGASDTRRVNEESRELIGHSNDNTSRHTHTYVKSAYSDLCEVSV